MKELKTRLGDRLVDAGYLTRQQLEEAVAHQQREGGLLGDVLVRYGFITPYDLSRFIYENPSSRLGEVLIQEGCLNQDQLNQVLAYQKQHGGRIGNICIVLGFVTEQQVEAALQKHARKKSMIGERLVESGAITREQLEHAVEMQRRSGGRLGEILLFLGFVDEDTLFRELANQEEMGRTGEDVRVQDVKNLPYDLASRHAALVIDEREDCFLLAVRSRLSPDAQREIEEHLGKRVEQVLATEAEMAGYWEERFRRVQRHKSVFDLYDSQPQNSAIVTFSTSQLVTLLVLALWLVVGLSTNWQGTLFGLNLFFQAIYAIMTVLKLWIVLKGEHKNTQLRFTPEEVAAIDERELPVYTILIPVYKETEVIVKLIQNISALDYPQHKLDVRILLEEDDHETIEVVRNLHLGSNYTAIVVPRAQPQTKPKACNYGLLRAKGEYVVIYDAEDRPEPDQLKKAYLAFKSLPKEFVCVQAKLNYFNSAQNALTKLFTQEYSMWFETLLVGIMQMDIPVPLGGTSNHFKLSFLKEVGGWDPFNVTEDADLGVRLFKFHYKTAVLDSRTWEEANSNVRNWIRQRSRWIKGYMQTWLVHMRHPIALFKSLGLRGFIGYQAMVLGTPLLPLVNPIFWGLLVLWYTTKAWWIQGLFPGAFYYIAAFQLLFGNFMFTYTNMIGMYAVVRDCALKRIQPFSYGLIKYALLTPVYWLLMSVAAYKAFFQLIRNPFYWEKTHHGLSKEEAAEENGGVGGAAPSA